MSFKRQATSELNHDNWDQEDPLENKDMGTFKTAPKDVLEQRVIKTAKRRAIGSNNEEAKKSIFSGFGGFNKTQPTSFDFLSNLTKTAKSNGESSNETDSKTSKLTSTTGIAQTSLFSTSQATFPSSNNTILTSQKSSLFSSSGVTPPASVFTMKAATSPNESPFQIKTNNNDMNKVNNSSAQLPSSFGTAINQGLFSGKSVASKVPVSQNTTTSQTVDNQGPSSSKKENETELTEHQLKYYSKLKALNEAVSEWIKKHVEATPICLLSPIFKDYENHLRVIQSEYAKAKNMASGTENKSEQTDTNNSSPSIETQPNYKTTTFNNSNVTPTSKQNTLQNNTGFSFGIKSSPNTAQSPTNTLLGKTESISTSVSKAPFAFGGTASPNASNPSPFANSLNTTTVSATPFSFKSNTSPTTTSPFAPATTTNTSSTGTPPPFSFKGTASSPTTSPFSLATNTSSGTAAPFSLGVIKPFSFNANDQKPVETTEDQDAEDEPPKADYTPVKEDSVYDKKCKIFVKKDGNFADKGVGTLYIKKIEDSDKHQLLVRANTNLGNVLLNFILSSSIPTQRMGKNNVMLVCIPTPDSKPPPTPILIRVKTSEEADELLETLDKFKA